MANQFWKITFFFEGVQQAYIGSSSVVGWTESWYADIASTVDAVYFHPDINKYIQLRLACLASRFRIAFVRISDEQQPRNFKIFSQSSLNGLQDSGEGVPTAQVQCAVLVDMARLMVASDPGDHSHHRRFLLRGLPADVISGDVINYIGDGWPDVVNFFNFLAKKQSSDPRAIRNPTTLFGLKYGNTDEPKVVNTQITLGDGAGTPSRYIALYNDTIGPLSAGDRIRITKSAVGPYNRLWTVIERLAAPTVHYTLGTARKALRTISATGLDAGVSQIVTPKYGLFDQYTVIGLRSKRTGKIFHQLRGRR